MSKWFTIVIMLFNLGMKECIAMEIYSEAFQDKGEIPSLYTCEGQNTSPPLAWKNVPANTKSLALIIDDPDAPDPKAPKMTWVHWVLFNINPEITHLDANRTPDSLPKGTEVGTTSWKNGSYGGPCPPIGRHRYFHKLYALDSVLTGLNHPTSEELMAAMQGHIIAEAVLLGTYQKQK